MEYLVRVAEPTDIPAIFDVRIAVTENAMSLSDLAQVGITPDAVHAMISDHECAWVAVIANRIVGFSMIDVDEGSLFAAFVLPSYEGHGIGRGLVEIAQERLLELHPVCWLETGRYTRAAGFYRRLGWGNERDVGGGDIRLEKCRAALLSGGPYPST